MCDFKSTKPWRKISAFTEAKEKQGSKRIILLGSTKCGKSALLCRFLRDVFLEEYKPTIEDLHSKRHMYKGFLLNLEIVDMCGPYMFPFMRDMRIKSADVAMVLYEIGKESSMEEAGNVLSKIKELFEVRFFDVMQIQC